MSDQKEQNLVIICGNTEKGSNLNLKTFVYLLQVRLFNKSLLLVGQGNPKRIRHSHVILVEETDSHCCAACLLQYTLYWILLHLNSLFPVSPTQTHTITHYRSVGATGKSPGKDSQD